MVGTAVGGLLAYGYVVMGTRTYGAAPFAPVSVLWTIWAMASAVVAFPVQHWVIRTIEADGNEGRVRSALPRILGAGFVVSAVLGVASWLARSILFSDSGLLYPVLAAAIPLGSVAVGLTRGGFSARRRFVAAAGAIAGENLIRVLAAVVVVLVGWGIEAFAVAIVTGFLVAFVWPSALRYDGKVPQRAHGWALSFLAGVAGGTLIAQVVLTGGPLLLAAFGAAPAEVTGLFAALALFRAPYILATGLAARLTGSLTRLTVQGGWSALRKVTKLTVAAVVLATPLGGVFGATVGPNLIGLVFGAEVSLAPELVGVVAAGSTVALGSLFCMLLLIAAGRSGSITLPWAVAVVVGIGWAIVGPGPPLTRVTWAFAIAEVVAFLSLVLVGRRALGAGQFDRGRTLGADDAAPPAIG